MCLLSLHTSSKECFRYFFAWYLSLTLLLCALFISHVPRFQIWLILSYFFSAAHASFRSFLHLWSLFSSPFSRFIYDISQKNVFTAFLDDKIRQYIHFVHLPFSVTVNPTLLRKVCNETRRIAPSVQPLCVPCYLSSILTDRWNKGEATPAASLWQSPVNEAFVSGQLCMSPRYRTLHISRYFIPSSHSEPSMSLLPFPL